MTKDDHVMSNITNKQFFKNYGYSQVDILKIKPQDNVTDKQMQKCSSNYYQSIIHHDIVR